VDAQRNVVQRPVLEVVGLWRLHAPLHLVVYRPPARGGRRGGGARGMVPVGPIDGGGAARGSRGFPRRAADARLAAGRDAAAAARGHPRRVGGRPPTRPLVVLGVLWAESAAAARVGPPDRRAGHAGAAGCARRRVVDGAAVGPRLVAACVGVGGGRGAQRLDGRAAVAGGDGARRANVRRRGGAQVAPWAVAGGGDGGDPRRARIEGRGGGAVSDPRREPGRMAA